MTIDDVVVGARGDKALRKRLLAEPIATLKAEGVELSDADLEKIAGGFEEPLLLVSRRRRQFEGHTVELAHDAVDEWRDLVGTGLAPPMPRLVPLRIAKPHTHGD